MNRIHTDGFFELNHEDRGDVHEMSITTRADGQAFTGKGSTPTAAFADVRRKIPYSLSYEDYFGYIHTCNLDLLVESLERGRRR